MAIPQSILRDRPFICNACDEERHVGILLQVRGANASIIVAVCSSCLTKWAHDANRAGIDYSEINSAAVFDMKAMRRMNDGISEEDFKKLYLNEPAPLCSCGFEHMECINRTATHLCKRITY